MVFLRKLFLFLRLKWKRFITDIRCSRKFANRPRNLTVGKEVIFLNPKHISWGENCVVNQRAAFCPLHSHMGVNYPSKIKIGNNVNFGAYDRIASAYSVTIEDDVLFTGFVRITDHSHGFEDINLPISKQQIIHKGPVVIGRGSWLAFGCHILSGVTIGEHCVVAANSVVTKDVPPFCVVAGNPARIVKRYNKDIKCWEKVNK